MQRSSITLIGPGGAGKSTVAALIAERFSIAFVDLDRRFADRVGDISEYITRFGYDAYAWENVETYRLVLQEEKVPCVAALSSGFMTYPQDIHPEYAASSRPRAEPHDVCAHPIAQRTSRATARYPNSS